MIVTFIKKFCGTCNKERNHECMVDLGKCVVCESVQAVEVPQKIEIILSDDEKYI